MARYREQEDGSVACSHRDVSCCADCLAADARLVDVLGAVFMVEDEAERANLRAMVAESDAAWKAEAR